MPHTSPDEPAPAASSRTSLCIGVDDSTQDVSTSMLTNLPDEIKLEVARYISRRRDLYNLSLTCRSFEDVVSRRLYDKLDIEVPELRFIGRSWSAPALPSFRPSTLGTVRELSIRHGAQDHSEPSYQRQRKFEAITVDAYVRHLLESIPRHQLHAFKFLHQSPLNLQMFEVLAESQMHALQDLEFFEAHDHLEHLHLFDCEVNSKISIPGNLRSLRCHSIRTGRAVGMLVQANKSSLTSLHLGQEKELADMYRRSRIGFLEQMTPLSDAFHSQVDLSALPQLRELSLVGLDLTLLLGRDASSNTYLHGLESLAIESCAGTTEFLGALTSTFRTIQRSNGELSNRISHPRLRSFFFRHEAINNTLKDTLLLFINSFHGLESLSLLFENTTLVERVASIVANHGSTLQTLVLESRIQPREHLGLDTSRPFGAGGYSHQLWQESIDDICESCPHLVELGMGFPWDDEMVRLKKTKLSQLSQLRTIHVRNFPQSQVLSQIGDYAIQEHARRFVEWCFPSRVGGDEPGLETLAIGPILYDSRWRSVTSTPASGTTANSYRRAWNPPEYLRTHHYCVDWAKSRFGRWHAMLTPVTERYVEERRDEKPLGGVFAPVWLR